MMLKTAFYTLVFIGGVVIFSACKTTTAAPEAVKAAFSQKFPAAEKVEWEKENDSEWEAEFKLDGKEHSANFATDGTWKETEYEVAVSELPVVVKQTVDSLFADYEIEEVELAENSMGIVYEFALEKGKTHLEVVIAADGKKISETNKKNEKKDKDNDDK